jgi:hypothetical protein
MQLMIPTPMKAARQARNASASSERRATGAAAMKSGSLQKGLRNRHVLPLFVATVHLSRVNGHKVVYYKSRFAAAAT